MKNHYEILNLEKNCSAKDIKDSFIKLSKKYHPDKNKSPDAHKKFVEVNEAYSVLGKNYSRIRYDEILSRPPAQSEAVYSRSPGARTQTYYEFYNPNTYGPNFKQNYEKRGNWNAPSKYKTLLFCCFLIAIGTGVRVMVIWKEIKRREKNNHDISIILKEIQERNHRLGRDQVLKEMEAAFLKNKAETMKRRDQ